MVIGLHRRRKNPDGPFFEFESCYAEMKHLLCLILPNHESFFFFPTKTSLSILIKCQEHMKNTTIMCLQCLSPEEKPCLATTQAATSVIRVGEMSGWCYVWTSDSYSDDLILFSVSPALTDLSFCSLFSITVCVWCSVTCFPGWSHLINSINGNCCSLCPDACPHKNVS